MTGAQIAPKREQQPASCPARSLREPDALSPAGIAADTHEQHNSATRSIERQRATSGACAPPSSGSTHATPRWRPRTTSRRHRSRCLLLLLAAAATAAGAALGLWSVLPPRTVARWRPLRRVDRWIKRATGSRARGAGGDTGGTGGRRFSARNHRGSTGRGTATSTPQIRPLPSGIDPPDSARPCPVDYPRLTPEQIAAGKPAPYLFGGQAPGCRQCRSDDPWTKFCTVRTSWNARRAWNFFARI